MKKKMAIGIAAGVVAVAVVAGILLLANGEKAFRSIAVSELIGTTVITDKSNVSSDAFLGQHLKDGDDAKVSEESSIMLLLDQDKYVYAEALTHFWLEATGSENETKSVIHLEEGDMLQYVSEKLGDAESFEVDTPASTMAVRGTVFRTKVFYRNGFRYTALEVYDGAVEITLHTTNGNDNGVTKTIYPGQYALMRADDTISEFVEEGEIDYKSVPEEMAYHLGEIIESGQELSITEELLYDYVNIIDHDFVEEVVKEATCSEDGIVKEVCSICGEVKSEKTVKAYNHSECEWKIVKEATCEEEGEKDYVCKLCQEVLETETLDALGHDYSNWKVTKAATCLASGEEERECLNCKEKETRTLKALSHVYSNTVVQKEATCTANGIGVRTCSVCGTKETVDIPAKGHSWGPYTVTVAADCIHAGREECYCSECGDFDSRETPAGGGHSFACTNHGSMTWGMYLQQQYAYLGIPNDQTYYAVVERYCSSCGTTENTAVYIGPTTVGHFYCPYCGTELSN